jgi:hypothetical protein
MHRVSIKNTNRLMLFRDIKCQGKGVPVSATKAHRESWDTVPLITNLGPKWRLSGQLHAPAALSSRKEPPLPTDYEAGWGPEPV